MFTHPLLLALPFLTLTATASPLTRRTNSTSTSTVQVQFVNEATGANENALIPLTNTPVFLAEAYPNLTIAETLPVTAFQFTGNFQNVKCNVLHKGATVASIINPTQDYKQFSATPVNWEGFAIACSRAPAPTVSKRTAETGQVRVQLSNDATGLNGNANITLTGVPVSVADAYRGTGIEVNGKLLATSFVFTSNFQGVTCAIKNPQGVAIAKIINSQKDFQTFSGVPLDLENGFTIACSPPQGV